MITDVENIILNKEYFELTPEELESVSEMVQSAEEYDEMKWFLASTQQTLVSDKIQATPELKEKVMAHLHQDASKRKFWLNGVVVFLWPTDKEVVRRPAFQMSLAALLLIGFLMVYNRDIGTGDNMAVNDVIDQEEMYESTENRDDGDKNEVTVVEDELDTKDGETAVENPVVIDNLVTAEEKEMDKSPKPDQPVDEISVLDDEDAEKPMTTVTDADGYYFADDEPTEAEVEEEPNTVSNANNNEGVNSSGYKSILEETTEDDSNKDYREESKPEKKKDRFKTRDQSRKNKKIKSKQSSTDQSIAEDFDMTYGNMYEQPADTTTLVLGSSRVNTGSDNSGSGSLGKVNDPGNLETKSETINEPNGGISLDANNDIIPNQMSVAQTGELKSLFKTYK